MSTQEILAAVASKKLTPADAARLLTSNPTRKARFQVKRNAKGGTFIPYNEHHDDYKAWAEEF